MLEFKEYKFITKIEKLEKLLIWIKAINDLLTIIEIGNYDFIKGKIWIDLKTYNQSISEGIDLGVRRF